MNNGEQFFNTAGGYSISRSLRCNSSDGAYLSRTFGTPTTQNTFTLSLWVKRSALGSTQHLFGVSTNHSFGFTSGDALNLTFGGSSALTTTAIFRDPSAWYHIVWRQSGTSHTLYVNNVSVGTTTATSSVFNTAVAHQLGAANTANYFSGYLADIHFIDGQALDPTSFGEFSATTGVWMPKAFSGGSYGTNGWQLKFEDNSSNTATTLGKDTSGNGNNWTPNNLSVTAGAGNDSLVDVPTNGSEVDTGVGGEVRGNYATLNPLNYTGTVTLSNGNLDATGSNANASSTIAPSSGKWYAEFSFSAIGAAVGFVGISNKLSADAFSGATQTWQLNYTNTGKLENAGSQSNVSTFTTGDIIGVAFDCSNGQATFYKNGSSVGTITGSAFVGVPVLVGVGAGGAAGTNTFTANYGARSFAYTAPSGFKALCTANLPAPTIEKPSTVMDVKVYPGNGSTQTISGFGFSPDLVWLKNRSAGDYHRLNDIIRGANRHLFSNTTDAEVVNDANGYLSAFTSDGFSLTSGTGVNASGNSYAAWCWDAGSSTVTNTQGSISGTVSVRANTTAGFSVVTYTGTGANATVGHGLGVAPKMVIIKRRDTTGNWAVYHAELANTQYMLLNSNAAVATGTTYWNSTSPTSTVFSVGTSADTNASGGTYVAYCFSAVSGYSAFGGYQAGTEPFVFLGFRPRYVMIKRTASGDGWAIFDTSRTTYNVATSRLEADTSAAEGGTDGVDLLSNGFKIKTTWGGMGGSSGSGLMVYAAFAESPFQYARAR